MPTRRKFINSASIALAAPYFFSTNIVKANPLTDGLVAEITRVSENMSILPIADQSGYQDNEVAGGDTVFARSIERQSEIMDPGFPSIVRQSVYTRSVCSNGIGYTFARFSENENNCCLPLGYVDNQRNLSHRYGGAMTLLEGPNVVGLRVITTELINRNYTSSQVTDFCWPVRLSESGSIRHRAEIGFRGIGKRGSIYLDRDVLHAKSAECAILYSHVNGEPDGGGSAALIINGREEFTVEFRYDTNIIART